MLSFITLTLVSAVLAKPTPAVLRRGVTALSTDQVNAFTPYTQFARAAYCDPSATSNWSCGEACQANDGFVPYATGGDGDSTQFYYVGYWPDQNTAVVAHQGTDPTQFASDLTDVNVPLASLDSSLFPNLPSGIQAHSGFLDEHAKTASAVLAAVNKVISDHGVSSITLIGHSLGGALALLDTVYFAQNLPKVSLKLVAYGLPRVGNPAFADYVSGLSQASITHINNHHDLIPIVPGRFLGYEHPSGEVHITDDSTIDGTWVSCPGEDDATDSQCEIMTVPDITDGSIPDHLGPYNGINLGTIYCT